MTSTHHDVVILGGGLAGLSLALQLKRRSPDVSVLILERESHPLPEAAHKVGESTVEIAARYFGDVLGMREHLEKEQILKPGLRFYMPAGDNSDITKRIEIGFLRWPKIPTFQIDRGRFENALAKEAVKRGAEFRDGTKVTQIELSENGDHHISAERDGQAFTVSARWVVDASGRTALLRKKLDLTESVPHDVSASWFRIGAKLDIHDFSDDPTWKERGPDNLRWTATNHLMGPGYWVWFIPLAGGADGGSTSIGIVADTEMHSFDSIRTLEKALEFIDKHEPQAAKMIRAHQDKVLDFKTLKKYAHRSKRVFSPSRWAIVGVAGCFHDPFYSPGSDLIAQACTFVTDLVSRDKKGEDVGELTEIYNQMCLEGFDANMGVFLGMYPLMGNPQVMALKMHYDYWFYWGVFAPLAYHDNRDTDPAFGESIGPAFERLGALYERMQNFFHKWHELDQRPRKPSYIDQYREKNVTYQLHCKLLDGLGEDELRERIYENIRRSETVVIECFRHAVRCCFPERAAEVEGKPLNPMAISLAPDKWEEEGLFDPEQAIESDPEVLEEVSRFFFEVDDAA